MMYQVTYKCQNCGAVFFEDVHRDHIVQAMKGHYCQHENLLNDLFDNSSFMITLFQKGGELHKCEMDVIGHGVVVGLRKIPL